jgi:hypothetical protein
MAGAPFKITLKIAINIDNKTISESDVHMIRNVNDRIVVLGGQFQSTKNIKNVYILTSDIPKLFQQLYTILGGSKISHNLLGQNIKPALELNKWYHIDDSKTIVQFKAFEKHLPYKNRCEIMITRTMCGFHSERIIRTSYMHTGLIKGEVIEWASNDTSQTRAESFEVLRTENVGHSDFYTEFHLRAKSDINRGKQVKSFDNFDTVPVDITDDLKRNVMFVRLGKTCGVWLQSQFQDLSALVLNNKVRIPVPAKDVTKSPSATEYLENTNAKLVVYVCRSASGLKFKIVIRATKDIKKGENIVLEGVVDDMPSMFYDLKIRSNNIVWNMVVSHRIPSYQELENNIRGRT